MRTAPLVVSPQDYPPALRVLDVSVTVLATNLQTDGIEVTLQSGGPGIGPPPHRHDWDESFYVLEGSVDMCIGRRTLTCPAGTLVHVPAGTVHGFRFGPAGGEMLEITGPGGRATEVFGDLSREIAPGPPDLSKVVSVLAGCGVTLA